MHKSTDNPFTLSQRASFPACVALYVLHKQGFVWATVKGIAKLQGVSKQAARNQLAAAVRAGLAERMKINASMAPLVYRLTEKCCKYIYESTRKGDT